MKYPVFNYEAQRWEDNKELLIKQLIEEKELLSDAAYLKFVGYNAEQAQCAIANINNKINSL